MVGTTNRKIKHDTLCDSSSTRFSKETREPSMFMDEKII